MGVGERIKQRRTELNLTQSELAKRMGYTSKTTISKVESGNDNITSDRITKFAKALNCSESYLMGWDEPKSYSYVDTDFVAMAMKDKETYQKLCDYFYVISRLSNKNLEKLEEYQKALLKIQELEEQN